MAEEQRTVRLIADAVDNRCKHVNVLTPVPVPNQNTWPTCLQSFTAAQGNNYPEYHVFASGAGPFTNGLATIAVANFADVDLNFVTNQGYNQGPQVASTSLITVSRASQGTDLLPTSAAGVAYDTFGNNVARQNALGLLIEESRTNQLLNSTAPVTQTTASLGTGSYTLWVNGAGTATPSGGTATITGAAAASQGSPNTFTVTVAGTVTVTVSGALNAFQLEAGVFGTSLIVTAGATATRAADVVTLTTMPSFGSAWTMYVSGVSYVVTGAPTNPDPLSLNIGGATTNEATLSIDRTAGKMTDALTVGGVGQYNSTLSNTVLLPGVFWKTAMALAAGAQVSVVNGTAVTHSVASIFTPTQAKLGARANSSQFINGYIERVTLWASSAVAQATLQSLTSGSAP